MAFSINILISYFTIIMMFAYRTMILANLALATSINYDPKVISYDMLGTFTAIKCLKYRPPLTSGDKIS